jgi:hypothetical protein
VLIDEVQFSGPVDQLRHVVDPELAVKPFPVPHDGGRFEAERLGNLIGGLSCGDQSENGDFLLSQGDRGGGFFVFHKGHFNKPPQKYTKKIRKTPHVYVETPMNHLKNRKESVSLRHHIRH